MSSQPAAQFLLCIKNDHYPVALEVRKVYQVIPDEAAAKRQMVRVVDESGEDYLYPQSYFVPVKLTKAAVEAFLQAS